jgi:hypothetical protein
MSIEEQIITISTFSDCNYRRELRAIALEVRKREDRIKQLEEMYEGVIGERPEFLGSNVMGLLKRELTGTQKRIKRLEEAGDEMANAYEEICHDSYDQKQIANWRKAKEDKL